MLMDSFTRVREEIYVITKHAPADIEHLHSQSVLSIVLRLKPDADNALKIAALSHDIDRSIPERRVHPEEFKDYNEYKRKHSERSAEIVVEIMRKCDCDISIIEKTKFLIENHEVGGSGDVEILKEADSISFFQDNLIYYQKKYPDYFKDKIRFMYKRLSPRARLLIRDITLKNIPLEKEVWQVISEIESSGE